MLNIGIIQMQATPLKVEENLSLAESLVAQVAKDGAQLVVLPEMFNVGYYFGEELMTVAETLTAGKTVKWLKSQAVRHNIHKTLSEISNSNSNGLIYPQIAQITPIK